MQQEVVMLCRCLVVSVSVALLAPGAAAQLTAAQATKQFKKALAEALGDTKSKMNESKAEFLDALALFEAELKGGTYATDDAEALFDALQAFMGEVGNATRVSGNFMSIAATDALAGFADGAALFGIFPAGFYPGDGGPIDVYRAAVRKAQDKTIAAVAKRFAKTRKLAEKEADIGLTLALAAPGAIRDSYFDEAGAFSESDETPITVDALMAVSDLAQTTDGVLFVGGSASPSFGAVAVEVSGPDMVSDSGGVPTSVFHRWGLVIDGGGLVEGSYIAVATQGTGGPLATGSIGVR
jgi:hypothetical protein